MILRPVSPVSAFGPADLEAAGGVHEDARARCVELRELPEHRVDDLGHDVGREERLDVDLLAVLRADEHGVDTRRADRPRTRWIPGDLPSGRRYGIDACLAHVGEPPRQPVRQAMGSGMSSSVSRTGEAEHHALVPGAQRVEIVVRMTLAMLERVVHALRDVGRLLLDRGHDPAGLAVEPELGVRVADLRIVRRTIGRDVDLGCSW